MLLKEIGIREQNVRLDGIYIGLIIEHKDPKLRGRCLIRVMGLHDMTSKKDKLITETDMVKHYKYDLSYGIWAEFCSPFQNSFEPPETGSYVYVMFRDPTDPMTPLIMGYVVSNYIK